MRVYVTNDPDGIKVYTHDAAIQIARRAVPQGREDIRTDWEALQDFMVVYWAVECTVVEKTGKSTP